MAYILVDTLVVFAFGAFVLFSDKMTPEAFQRAIAPERLELLIKRISELDWEGFTNAIRRIFDPTNLERVFEQIDLDKSGDLSFTELKRGLKVCGIKNADYVTIFKDLDANSDGKISFDEFQWGLEYKYCAHLETIVAALNDDGLVDSLYLSPEDEVRDEEEEQKRLKSEVWDAEVRWEAVKEKKPTGVSGDVAEGLKRFK
eukprot:CAMPEP_0169122106 /NCGR_PEP_ID=MMETSP1015-20121227/33036_1 /TAXON_ID=342587 /ORGANISM="Karlodinium micrum, Strain CCMP2283" /LENGTH=200 /DNA_ID=CAMNT_0009185277 /DNA_START=247 /DNA_END=849 /DNA_ORIENTATION=+